MVHPKDIDSKVAEAVTQVVLNGRPVQDLEMPFSELGADSLTVLRLMIRIEDEFDITFSSDDLLQAFRSTESLAQHVTYILATRA
jgi:acyl carrier protein